MNKKNFNYEQVKFNHILFCRNTVVIRYRLEKITNYVSDHKRKVARNVLIYGLPVILTLSTISCAPKEKCGTFIKPDE